MRYTPKEYDYFISHASEDKDSFVRPLANELIRLGFKVWYDEITLKLGDSLFEEISNGIKKSDFGIVVISKNFFKKEWTKKELNGLINKEIFTSSNIILPIWLGISLHEVYSYSPILADKVSILIEANEIDKVVKQILLTTKHEIVTKKMVADKIDYLKKCTIYERKKYLIDAESRVRNLSHFQEAYFEWYCSIEAPREEDDVDEFLSEKKRHEFLSSYSLPRNVVYNPEFYPNEEMKYVLRLVKKWILQKS